MKRIDDSHYIEFIWEGKLYMVVTKSHYDSLR